MVTIRFLAVMITAAMGIAGLALVHVARAQEPGLRFDRVLVCPDTSGSLDTREYDAILSAVQRALPDIAIAVHAREVALLPWAESLDAWRSPRSVLLPPPVEIGQCVPTLGEAERLFRPARLLAESKAKAEYDSRNAAAQTDYRHSVEETVRPLVALLGSCRSGSATCTAFSDLLARCGTETPGTLVLILTDGQEERCSEAPPPPFSRPVSGVEVVVILLPGGNDDGAAGTIRHSRQSTLQREAPWTHVVPSFRISDRDLAWLTTALASPRSPSQPSAAMAATGGGR
jgi:hypothetical protein